MGATEASAILKYLEVQKSGYQQIIQLVEKQKEAIKQDNDKELLQIIQKKNDCLTTIRKAEVNMEAVMKGLTAQEIEQLKTRGAPLRDEVVSIIETLIQAESECTQALESKKIDTESELKELKTKKKSIREYGAYTSTKGTGFSSDV